MAKSKYRAIPTVVDGIRFDSKREAARYGELKLLEKAGEISNLCLQPRFVLTVDNRNYPDNGYGRSIVLGAYVGDFMYVDRHKGKVVEDVKGFKTPLYRWKKKHVEAQHGISITEVK